MKYCFAILLLLMYCICPAQDKADPVAGRRITGTAVTEKNEPVKGATVTLVTPENKGYKLTLTDQDGHFEFMGLKPSHYDLLISATGFRESVLHNLNLSDSLQISLPPQTLQADVRQLKDIIVTAKRPLLEHKLDHIVFNVSASPFLQGLNSLEAIGQAPGIEIAPDGSISYNRKAVLVLIDGKQTYLTGDALATMLRGLMAGHIDHVEFYTVPPARFDAGGGGPIINIVTKRIKAGFSGSSTTTFTQAKYASFGASISLNYQKNKWGGMLLYNYGNVHSFFTTATERHLYSNGLPAYETQSASSTKNHSLNQFFKTALSCSADRSNTLGFVLTGQLPQQQGTPVSTSKVNYPDQTIFYQEETVAMNQYRSAGWTVNINYSHRFDSTASLSLDLDHSTYRQRSHQDLSTQFMNATGGQAAPPLLLRADVPSSIRVRVGQLNFTKQLPSSFQLETGIKSSWVQSDNQQDFERNTGTSYIKDGRSNHFLYTETIHAAFATLTREGKKIKYSAGLRMEETKGQGRQLTTGTVFQRDTLNYFPSFHLQWQPNDRHNFSLGFSKRIGRPNYQDLNPFIDIADSLNYFQGNPDLQPYYTYTYSASHSYKNRIFTSLEYTDYRNMFAHVTYPDARTQVSLHTIENVNALKATVLTVTLVQTLWKKINLSFSQQIYQTNWRFNRQGQQIDLVKNSYYGYLKLSESFQHGFACQVEGLFLTKSLDMLIYTGRRGYFNISAMKKIWHDQGLLKLDLVDPLALFYISGTTQYADVFEQMTNHSSFRRMRLSFTYSFAKGHAAMKNRQTASEELQSRIGK